MLDDLVLSSGCAAADDSSVTVLLEGEGVFADCGPPNIFDSARALALNDVSTLQSYVRDSR